MLNILETLLSPLSRYTDVHPHLLRKLAVLYTFMGVAGVLALIAAAVCAGLIFYPPKVLSGRKYLKWGLWGAIPVLVGLGAVLLVVRAGTPGLVGIGRFDVLRAMAQRPHDPWPRSSGHSVLGAYGSLDSDKAYLEPGGSFSPAPNTFGLSIWVEDASGKIVTTSDTLPLEQSLQTYADTAEGQAAIITETPYYKLEAKVGARERYTLKLTSKVDAQHRLLMAVRSVGPAGGRLETIDYSDGKLKLGKDWSLEGIKPGTLVYMGEEGRKGWMADMANVPNQAQSAHGWAHARFIVPGQALELRLTGPELKPHPKQAFEARADLTGGDERFTDALKAQIYALKLSLVGDETRPGDPYNYRMQWDRDGGYILTALARSGQIDLAKSMMLTYAENDFFGGFGAEADGPGFELWAIGEVSKLAHDPAFDRKMWPYVKRKAALILELKYATKTVEKDFAGPVIPQLAKDKVTPHHVALPAKDGLIIGRMDGHYPVFFVNGMSYLGLRNAASMAKATGHADMAGLWSREADATRDIWRKSFGDKVWASDVADDRTFISGLWPSDLAPRERFKSLLDERWKKQWRPDGDLAEYPLWTYFTIAEAHQWVRLGHADRTWQVMRWFWDRQPAPGLYSFWESNREENSFGLWQNTRGWITPEAVTPHYWTAAEMLLMQLEMMAYVDNSLGEPQLIIGAGVPATWLKNEVSVNRIGTSAGFVDWRWDGHGVAVTVHGKPITVKLGNGFPEKTPLKVRYL